jgi:hypothetical protein
MEDPAIEIVSAVRDGIQSRRNGSRSGRIDDLPPWRITAPRSARLISVAVRGLVTLGG